MKRLLFLLLLLAMPVAAQNGGTAFVVPVSGGTNSGSGAASGSSSLGATNLLTTNCIVTANSDTNVILVSGAGTAAANGTYRHNPAAGTFTNGALAIYFDAVTEEAWLLTNAVGSFLYNNPLAARPTGAWSEAGGTGSAPAPTSVYGSVTNCYSYSYGLEPRTNVIYINCGDTNFLAKISNAPNNSVIFIGACAQGYPFATWSYASNKVAVPLSLVSKTNIEMIGFGMPSFDTSQTPFGDTMMASNCSRIKLTGFRLQSMRMTNGTGPAYPHAFQYGTAAFRYMNCEYLTIDGIEVVNHNDQGIMDGVANAGGLLLTNVFASTNGIVVRNSTFRNGGNWYPTNVALTLPSSHDGAAVITAGGVIEDNYIYDWVAGIEPYSDNNGTNLTVRVSRNTIVNYMALGIQDGGSGSRFKAMEIVDNTLIQHIGFTRDGGGQATNGAGIKTTGTNNVLIARNKIYTPTHYGIYLSFGNRAKGINVVDNWIVNATNHGIAAAGFAIYQDGGPMHESTISRNQIWSPSSSAIRLVGVRDSVVEGNRIVFDGTTTGPAIHLDTGGICSNLTLRANSIRGGGVTWRGIQIEAGHRRIFAHNNTIEDVLAGEPLILSQLASPYELSVDGTWPLSATNVTTFTSGFYTNNPWDRLVGIGNHAIGRTNVLPNAANSNYFKWPITVYDSGFTAAGTNLWLMPVAGQTINGAATPTNIAVNGGSITLISVEGNWSISGSYP